MTVDNRVSLSTKREYRLNSDTLFEVVTSKPYVLYLWYVVNRNNIMAFIHVTNETLDIDSHYQSTVTTAACQLSHSVNHPCATPPTTPSIVPPTTTLPLTAMTPIRSTLNCSNCHG
jgi:hypothetical protein